MTTDDRTAPRRARPYGVTALGLAVLAGAACGLVVAVLGGLLGGSAGLLGAVVGAGVALLVLATGFAVVDLVAGLIPAFSVVVALLTYTLQMVLLAALLAVLRGADDVAATLAPGWFAAGVVGVALSWTACLLVHATRARVPLYDLPAQAPGAAAEGSER